MVDNNDLGFCGPPPIHEIAPDIVVEGPVSDLEQQIRDLHYRFHRSA